MKLTRSRQHLFCQRIRRLAFLQVKPGLQTLKISGAGLETRVYPGIEVATGEVTLLHCVPVPGSATPPPLFRIISPRLGASTSREKVNVAVHTDPENKVLVNGESVHVFKTVHTKPIARSAPSRKEC